MASLHPFLFCPCKFAMQASMTNGKQFAEFVERQLNAIAAFSARGRLVKREEACTDHMLSRLKYADTYIVEAGVSEALKRHVIPAGGNITQSCAQVEESHCMKMQNILWMRDIFTAYPVCVCIGDREARLLSGLLIRELQKQAAEAFAGQASQVCPPPHSPSTPPPLPTPRRLLLASPFCLHNEFVCMSWVGIFCYISTAIG